MIMCVLLCYPVSIRIYYQQGVLFLVVTSIYAAWYIGIASSSNFVASSSIGVCRRHTFYSGQYLKNGLSDLIIQIWHVDVTGSEGVLYSFVTLNSY